MTNLRRVILLAACLGLGSSGDGQPVHNNVLQPLAFLSGRWVSETPAELQEENWTPVSGDSMTGSFRIVSMAAPSSTNFGPWNSTTITPC